MFFHYAPTEPERIYWILLKRNEVDVNQIWKVYIVGTFCGSFEK